MAIAVRPSCCQSLTHRDKCSHVMAVAVNYTRRYSPCRHLYNNIGPMCSMYTSARLKIDMLSL